MNDAGKGMPISVVEDEGDMMLAAEITQAAEFIRREDIARRIRGTGDAHGGDIRRDFEAVEIDTVFDLVLTALLDVREDGGELPGRERLIGIAEYSGSRGKRMRRLPVALSPARRLKSRKQAL